jgi:hypothetical protein
MTLIKVFHNTGCYRREEDEDSDGAGQEQHEDLEGAGQEHHEDLEGSGQEHHSGFTDDEGKDGDRSTTGLASRCCQFRKSHVVTPPVEPQADNNIVIILSSDG